MQVFLFFHSPSVDKQRLNAAISDQSVSGGVHADKEGLAAHTEQIIALLLKSSIWRERILLACHGDQSPVWMEANTAALLI